MAVAAVAETALGLSTQRLLFAGQPVLFCTNSSQLAMYARGYLPKRGRRDSSSDSSECDDHGPRAGE